MQGLKKHSSLSTPGLMLGNYPERSEHGSSQRRGPRRLAATYARRLEQRLAKIQQQIDCTPSPAHDPQRHIDSIRTAFAAQGFTPHTIDSACALVVTTAHRTLGKTAYDCQIRAALAMLDQQLVEMATGEGKSLAMALAAAIAGLAGIPVHLMTANDYLVARDEETFRPLFTALGIRSATVLSADTSDQRRAAYASDVLYVTAREVAFDYLRDRKLHRCSLPDLRRRALALSGEFHAQTQPLLRGLCMALIDEADHILIDEAQMPLILSQSSENSAQRAFLWQAYSIAGRLTAPADYKLLPNERQVLLSDAGRVQIESLASKLSPAWKNRQHREETIITALTARHLFHRDRDYVVTDGQVRIIDPLTGRIAEGRRWGQGLHALIGIKESCKIESENETLAQITFQRFFRRYLRLGGMSGTLREARRELLDVYGLATHVIAPRLPNQRQHTGMRIFTDAAARWHAVAQHIEELHQQGRPVLIGTDSVADSEHLSHYLNSQRVKHVVLNAHHDQHEASIIARAGCSCAVTVSTNMAGRGTDIHPDRIALAAGGLHVISCQFNSSPRLDRQLAGRAGRQGQPGSVNDWIELSTARLAPSGWQRWLIKVGHWLAEDGEIHRGTTALAWLIRRLQSMQDRSAMRARKRLLDSDLALDQSLIFTDQKH